MKYYFEEDENKLIQNNDLDFIEKSIFFLYPLISIFIFWNIPEVSTKHVFIYLALTHISIYVCQTNLRNKYLFVFSLFMGLVHFVISFFLWIDPILKMSLRLTFFLLLITHFIRFLSLKIQKREIIIPSKYSSDGANIFEYLLFFGYMSLPKIG